MRPQVSFNSLLIARFLCWVFKGWFPAKFVEILDERSKEV